jgi:hypothetical protein
VTLTANEFLGKAWKLANEPAKAGLDQVSFDPGSYGAEIASIRLHCCGLHSELPTRPVREIDFYQHILS